MITSEGSLSHRITSFLSGLCSWTTGPWTKSSFQFSSQGGSEAGLKVLIWGGRWDWRNAQMSKLSPEAFSVHASIISGLWKHFIWCLRQRTIIRIHNKLQPSYWLKFTIPLKPLSCQNVASPTDWSADWIVDDWIADGLQSARKALCACKDIRRLLFYLQLHPVLHFWYHAELYCREFVWPHFYWPAPLTPFSRKHRTRECRSKLALWLTLA